MISDKWLIHKKNGKPFEICIDRDYCIPVEELKDYYSRLSWYYHMMHKRWITDKALRNLMLAIDEVTGSHFDTE